VTLMGRRITDGLQMVTRPLHEHAHVFGGTANLELHICTAQHRPLSEPTTDTGCICVRWHDALLLGHVHQPQTSTPQRTSLKPPAFAAELRLLHSGTREGLGLSAVAGPQRRVQAWQRQQRRSRNALTRCSHTGAPYPCSFYYVGRLMRVRWTGGAVRRVQGSSSKVVSAAAARCGTLAGHDFFVTQS
jgi:hypothetical protein